MEGPEIAACQWKSQFLPLFSEFHRLQLTFGGVAIRLISVKYTVNKIDDFASLSTAYPKLQMRSSRQVCSAREFPIPVVCG